MSFFRGTRTLSERASEVALWSLGFGTVGLLVATEMVRRNGDLERFREKVLQDREAMAKRATDAFANHPPGAQGDSAEAAAGATLRERMAARLERALAESQRGRAGSESRQIMAEDYLKKLKASQQHTGGGTEPRGAAPGAAPPSR